MKSIIKTITTVLIIVISFASAEFVNANTATADTLTQAEQALKFEQIERSLLYGLESEVTGVLESTFFNAIAFKTLYPEFDSKAVTEGIARIVSEDGNHVVRYKALLTLYYLRNQETFDYQGQLTVLVRSNDKAGAFQLLNEQIRDSQLASQVN